MKLRKLAIIPAVLLMGVACTPREVQLWKEWHSEDPDAAMDFARELAQEAEAEDQPRQQQRQPQQQRSSNTSSSNSGGGTVWDRLAQCESGGNWSINTGNGYYGGLQFSLQSWRAVGGSGRPDQASRGEQIARAETLLDMQGWGAWPACSRKLGLR